MINDKFNSRSLISIQSLIRKENKLIDKQEVKTGDKKGRKEGRKEGRKNKKKTAN